MVVTSYDVCAQNWSAILNVCALFVVSAPLAIVVYKLHPVVRNNNILGRDIAVRLGSQ